MHSGQCFCVFSIQLVLSQIHLMIQILHKPKYFLGSCACWGEKMAPGGLHLYFGRVCLLEWIAQGMEFNCQGSFEGYIMTQPSSKMGKNM